MLAARGASRLPTGSACRLHTFSFQDLLGGWVKIHFLQQLKGGRVEIVKIVDIVNVGAVNCELS